jgi:hypothetical protein
VALVRERTMPTERPPLVREVVPTFADRGCRVVSATDSHGRYSRLSRPEPLLFLPSSSSVVLTRLSGPCSRPAASRKIVIGMLLLLLYYCCNINVLPCVTTDYVKIIIHRVLIMFRITSNCTIYSRGMVL